MNVVKTSQGFDVVVDGIDIMSHSPDRPLMTIGRGTFEAKEHLGNFELSDNIEVEYQLTNYHIGQLIRVLT